MNFREFTCQLGSSFGVLSGACMSDREPWASRYDLFEIDNGRRIWRTQVIGLMHAGSALRKLTSKTRNQCLIVDQSTSEVVARLNIPAGNPAPHVFQIAYDRKIAEVLAYELPDHGYRFSYAAANDLALAILTTPIECDVFIVGCAATIDARRGMTGWLNANYPDIPIIALKSPSEPDVAAAHFNLELDGDRALLPTIAQALKLRRRTD
jgi:hypothetical protein